MQNQKSSFTVHSILSPLLVLLLSVLACYYFYGFDRISPQFIDWVYHLDSGTHYLGWAYFRNDPWAFPLGKTLSYGYPVGTNIGLTDSIPLLAIPLKLLNPLLPSVFQYLGLTVFLNFILQGLAGYWVARLKGVSFSRSIALALLLILSTPFLLKTPIHIALSTQWPLILALGICGNPLPRFQRWWYLLFLLLSLVHPYLWGMLFLIALFDLWLRFPRLLSREVVVRILKYLTLSIFVWLFVGVLGGTEVVSPGIGGFSAHLSALFDPVTFSAFFPGLVFHHQNTMEAYAYLGVGGILLFLGALAYRLQQGSKISSIEKKRFYFILGVFFISGSFVFALGDFVILDLFKPMKLIGFVKFLSVFRTTGRFIWIVYYATLIWSFLLLARLNKTWITPFLFLIVGIQFMDLHKIRELTQYRSDATAETHWMNSPHWKELCLPKKHIYFYPNEYDIARLRYAYECGATVNTAYSARAPKGRDQKMNEIYDRLLSGDLEADSLYVLKDELKPEEKVKLMSNSKLHVEIYENQIVIQ